MFKGLSERLSVISESMFKDVAVEEAVDKQQGIIDQLVDGLGADFVQEIETVVRGGDLSQVPAGVLTAIKLEAEDLDASIAKRAEAELAKRFKAQKPAVKESNDSALIATIYGLQPGDTRHIANNKTVGRDRSGGYWSNINGTEKDVATAADLIAALGLVGLEEAKKKDAIPVKGEKPGAKLTKVAEAKELKVGKYTIARVYMDANGNKAASVEVDGKRKKVQTNGNVKTLHKLGKDYADATAEQKASIKSELDKYFKAIKEGKAPSESDSDAVKVKKLYEAPKADGVDEDEEDADAEGKSDKAPAGDEGDKEGAAGSKDAPKDAPKPEKGADVAPSIPSAVKTDKEGEDEPSYQVADKPAEKGLLGSKGGDMFYVVREFSDNDELTGITIQNAEGIEKYKGEVGEEHSESELLRDAMNTLGIDLVSVQIAETYFMPEQEIEEDPETPEDEEGDEDVEPAKEGKIPNDGDSDLTKAQKLAESKKK